ncbi:LuxR C-terminal-related transcriptional regulator [Proteiniphilum acetatigenes]|uniref:LuxR C-terminal-related transcriptional regulator n=1 Tax=Proteiniphilum acetatigenes TaxID=294710 RepID=UPI000380B8D7|nr:LuxR C-terminal-related transcriptional regulator [Proteiniphilum acetatigenes]SFK45721.1 Tetratricopeptide repeat-containing protein [Porphyromonadaceae bacterium KH3CP3RA]
MKGVILFAATLLAIAGCSSPKDPPATEVRKVDSLLELSYQSNRAINPEASLRYALEALDPAKSVGYRKGIARVYYLISNALYNTGSYNKSLEYILLGEEYADGDAQILSDFIRIRARIYTYMGLYESAKKEFLKGLSYIKEIKQRERREFLTALTYENLSHFYAVTDRPDSSLLYVQKNMKILNELDEDFVYTSLINSFTTIGKFYVAEQKYDSAGIYFDKAIQLAEKYTFSYHSRTWAYRGDMHFQKNEVDSALYYYFKALDNLEETGLKGEYKELYGKISNAYSSQGDTTAAHEYENKKLLIEGQLNEEKLKSTQKVLTLLTNEEKTQMQKRYFIILRVIIPLFLLLIIFTWWFVRQYKVKYIRKEAHEMEIYKIREQETEKLKIRLNKSLDEIIELVKKNDPTFMIKFQEAYPRFTTSLLAINPKIQPSELHLCALIYLQFTTKEIADSMYRSVKTIQNRKNSLRKKLDIPSDIDIAIWLNEVI